MIDGLSHIHHIQDLSTTPQIHTHFTCVCLSPQILDVRNVMVVVSRWYGGILLGPDRFKHINNCARNILVEEGYAASTVRHLPGLLWIILSSSTDTSSVKFYWAVSFPMLGNTWCLVVCLTVTLMFLLLSENKKIRFFFIAYLTTKAESKSQKRRVLCQMV